MTGSIYVFPDATEEVELRQLAVSANYVCPPRYVRKWRRMTPYIFVATISGTAPTLDVAIEGQYDGKWTAIHNFPQITAVGNYRQAPIEIVENRIRFSITIGGTNPSFTITLGAIYKS